jgi:hypothetical protein
MIIRIVLEKVPELEKTFISNAYKESLHVTGN